MLDNTGFLVGKFSYWVRGIQCPKSKDSFSKIVLEKKLHFSLTDMGKIANSTFSIWAKWQFGHFRASKNNPNCKFHFLNFWQNENLDILGHQKFIQMVPFRVFHCAKSLKSHFFWSSNERSHQNIHMIQILAF